MKQITKDHLIKLRNNQQKSHYASRAKAMFKDGLFDYNNWNGGDGIIRQFFYQDSDAFMNTIVDNINFTYKDIYYWGDIIITHTINEDQSYATIAFRGDITINDVDQLERFEHVAFFTWYKSRGTTESARYNGHIMAEDEYLFVLNALQATGFEFAAF